MIMPMILEMRQGHRQTLTRRGLSMRSSWAKSWGAKCTTGTARILSLEHNSCRHTQVHGCMCATVC